MNNYSMEQIEIGMRESFSVKVTEEMMAQFESITGDHNPLHQDDNYAKGQGFAGKVCYGMLTSSFLSTLAGMYLPGRKSLIEEVAVKFVKPVFLGDVLQIVGEVAEKQERFSRILVKVTIRNQSQEKVLRGKMLIGLLG